jgi:oligosaccharyltransferase complex subunit beta
VHTIGLNPYLVEVLHSSKTAYVGEERVLDADEAEVEAATSGKGEKEAVWTGKKAALVSAMQTRDNVRIGFVGSGAMLRDDYWGMSVDGPDGRSYIFLCYCDC